MASTVIWSESDGQGRAAGKAWLYLLRLFLGGLENYHIVYSFVTSKKGSCSCCQ